MDLGKRLALLQKNLSGSSVGDRGAIAENSSAWRCVRWGRLAWVGRGRMGLESEEWMLSWGSCDGVGDEVGEAVAGVWEGRWCLYYVCRSWFCCNRRR
jgi:hypothetical protein